MPKKRIKRYILLAVGIAAVISAVMITSGLHAKYVRKVSLNGSVEFASELAKNVTLNESKAEIQSSGRYELLKSEKVTENSYKVMPGVNIPKDPQITITGKTGIPSYLYVKVEEKTIPNTVRYSLCSHWQKVVDNVYVYTGDDFNSPINIIEKDTLYVSQNYNGENFGLNFTAYLYQKIGDETAEQTYDRASNES